MPFFSFPPSPAAPLLNLVQATNSFWALHPPSANEAHPTLAAEAQRLNAVLGAWLDNQSSISTTRTTSVATTKKRRTAAAAATVQLLDLPAPSLLEVFSILLPANPGSSATAEWADFGAFSATCHHAHYLSKHDLLWRPLSEQLSPSLTNPALRALWRTRDWSELFQRMARTSMCLEPGGYRARWWEDYVLQTYVRDMHLNTTLFSQWYVSFSLWGGLEGERGEGSVILHPLTCGMARVYCRFIYLPPTYPSTVAFSKHAPSPYPPPPPTQPTKTGTSWTWRST